MKTVILLFTFIIVTTITDAQVASSCIVPPVLVNHYERDIKNLTLGRMYELLSPDTALVKIPQLQFDSVAEGMAAILNSTSIPETDSVFNLYCVHDNNDFYAIVNGLLVRVDTNYAWTHSWQNLISATGDPYIDTVLSRYSLQIDQFYNWSIGNYALLATDSLWNIYALIDTLELAQGIISAEPNNIIGNAGHITYSNIAGTRYYNFYCEFNDCFDGCDNYHEWQFKVNTDCSVEYLGFTDWGIFGISPLPPPINCNFFTGIKTPPHEINCSIFPNPTNGKTTLYFKGKLNYPYDIIIYELAGREISRINNISNDKFDLDLNHYPNGLYICKILVNDQQIAAIKINKE